MVKINGDNGPLDLLNQDASYKTGLLGRKIILIAGDDKGEKYFRPRLPMYEEAAGQNVGLEILSRNKGTPDAISATDLVKRIDSGAGNTDIQKFLPEHLDISEVGEIRDIILNKL